MPSSSDPPGSPVPRSAVWTLGAGQCVFWGILYYAYAALLVPMRTEFGASESVVAGAWSLGLGVGAALAPRVGHALDRGHGPVLHRVGMLAAALLLLAWSAATSIAVLYLVWLGLGACMALVLYEAAFALLTRAIPDPSARLAALASVTVLGGLASTVFLPLIGAGVVHLGWRTTLRFLAVAWLLAAWAVQRYALPALADKAAAAPIAPVQSVAAPERARVALVGLPFVVATFVAMALTTLVIPMLVDRGHPLERAALVLAGLGIMQLPGRLWLWRRGGQALSPRGLLVAPLLLQSAGLALLALTHGLLAACAGVALFGIGAGLHTLARPWLVPQLFGVAAAGRVNGAIARAQGIARAIGPYTTAAAYGSLGSDAVFGVLALALLLMCPLGLRFARELAGTNAAAR